jgi:hypothetical protein
MRYAPSEDSSTDDPCDLDTYFPGIDEGESPVLTTPRQNPPAEWRIETKQ